MAKRYPGEITFGSIFKPNGKRPLDDRTVVQYESDLTTAFVNNAYEGMVVAVLEKNATYLYKGGSPTVLSNWIKQASNAGVDTANASITTIKSNISDISSRMSEFIGDFNAFVSSSTGAKQVIDTFKDVSNFLADITDSSTLAGILTTERTTTTNAINDLNTSVGTYVSNLSTNIHSDMNSYKTNVNSSLSDLSTNLHSDISTLKTNVNTSLSDLSSNIAGKLSDLETRTGSNVSTQMSQLKSFLGTDASFKNASFGNKSVVDYVIGVETYDTGLADSVKTTVAIGDIPAGTTAQSLKGLSIDQVLTKILFKDYQPTYTTPSITITTNSPKYIELGQTIAMPTVNVTDGYVKCMSSDGVTWNNTSTKSYTTWSNTSTWTPTFTSGTTKPTAVGLTQIKVSKTFTVNNSAWNGMTSQGNNATVPTISEASKTVQSNTINTSVVYPVYVNGNVGRIDTTVESFPATACTSLNKIVTGDYVFTALFATQAAGTPFRIYLPAGLTISSANALGTFSGQFDEPVIFTQNSSTLSLPTANGNMSFKLYEYNNPNRGNAKIKFVLR